jgi:hypothetical protein
MIILVFGCINVFSAATVRLNNYDSMMPIYYKYSGNLASGDKCYVQVFGGFVGSKLFPVVNPQTGQSIFHLNAPGYFDGGVGIIAAVPDGSPVSLEIIAWKGTENYATSYEDGTSGTFFQFAGSWDSNSGLPPTGPSLQIPHSIGINMYPVPEPSIIALVGLGMVGFLLFLGPQTRSSSTQNNI